MLAYISGYEAVQIVLLVMLGGIGIASLARAMAKDRYKDGIERTKMAYDQDNLKRLKLPAPE